jgi:hypothetical protein
LTRLVAAPVAADPDTAFHARTFLAGKTMGFQKTGEELLRAGVTLHFDRADLTPQQGRRVPAVNRARDQQH